MEKDNVIPRAHKHEKKVKFESTLEDMIKIAVKPIHKKGLWINSTLLRSFFSFDN
jgi:hypothetical protein